MSNPVQTGTQFRDAAKRLFGSLDSTGDTNVDNFVGKRRYRLSFMADATAGDTANLNFEVLDEQVLITSVKILPDANLTANGTNYKTFTLKYDDGAGGSATSIASVDTSAVSWVANQPVALAITAANALVASGKQLRMEITKAASGVATPNMTFLIDALVT